MDARCRLVAVCTENGPFGIVAEGGGAAILMNTCTRNGVTSLMGTPTNGAGILITNAPGCRVEGNYTWLNYYGIQTAANQSAIVLRNTASTSINANYIGTNGNAYGPIAHVPGVGEMTGVAGANHPQANFSF